MQLGVNYTRIKVSILPCHARNVYIPTRKGLSSQKLRLSLLPVWGERQIFYIFPEHSDMKVWLKLGSKEDLRVTSRLALFLLFSKKKRGEVSDKLFPMLKKRHHQESAC